MLTDKIAINLLRDHADTGRLEFARRTYPSNMEMLGVTMPNFRLILKEINQDLKGASLDDVWNLAKSLLNSNIMEAHLLAIEIMAAPGKRLGQVKREMALQMMTNMDNWVTIDTYATKVSGPLWDRGVLTDQDILPLSRAEDFWIRRIAIVSCVGLFRSKKKSNYPINLERTFQICDAVLDDRTSSTVKAVSWALRSAIPAGSAEVLRYVELKGNQLAPKVVREVMSKLETGRKL